MTTAKRPRGMGRIFQRGPRYWIGYSVDGQEHREPGGASEHEAERKLTARLKEKFGGTHVGPKQERVTVAELLDTYLADLRLRGAKALRTTEVHLARIRRALGRERAMRFAAEPERIQRWAEAELTSGAARETVRHLVGILRAAFNLAGRHQRLTRVPAWPRIKPGTPREGFFERDEYRRVLERLRAVPRRKPIDDIVAFAYLTGWRKAEILGLRWAWVDRHARLLRLPDSKNDAGRVLPLVGALWMLIEKRWTAREYEAADDTITLSEYVFHRRGRPLRDIDWAWRSARREAGLPAKLFHDFRRTAVRDLVDAGAGEKTAMEVTGHKTRSVFDRYNIRTTRDMARALEATEAYRARREARVTDLAAARAHGQNTDNRASAVGRAATERRKIRRLGRR